MIELERAHDQNLQFTRRCILENINQSRNTIQEKISVKKPITFETIYYLPQSQTTHNRSKKCGAPMYCTCQKMMSKSDKLRKIAW